MSALTVGQMRRSKAAQDWKKQGFNSKLSLSDWIAVCGQVFQQLNAMLLECVVQI